MINANTDTEVHHPLISNTLYQFILIIVIINMLIYDILVENSLVSRKAPIPLTLV